MSFVVLLFLWLTNPASAQHPAGVEPGESYHRIFVTESVYDISSSSSFPPPLNSINGLTGADWHVTRSAFNAGRVPGWNGLDLVYTAILSTSSADANTRFAISGKIYNTQGQKVADDAPDLWDGTLDTAIQFDEFGATAGSSEVWSGSNADGSSSGRTCGNWTVSSFDCDYGDAFGTSSEWLQDDLQPGSNTARLYGISPAITLPDSADFDGSDLVDGADLLTWQRNFGSGTAHAEGDANGDDLVNTADLTTWQTQFGLTANQTFAVQGDFLASVEGEVLQSFEANASTNARDTTLITAFPFQLQSSADMGLFEQPPFEVGGAFPTEGTHWVVSQVGGSVTLEMLNLTTAEAIGLSITDFGDSPGTYDLVAEVGFLDGNVESFTLASSGLPDGNQLFWGISTSTLGSPIRQITFTYGEDSIGIDEVYVVVPTAVAALAIPEPASAALLLLATAGGFLKRSGRIDGGSLAGRRLRLGYRDSRDAKASVGV